MARTDQPEQRLLHDQPEGHRMGLLYHPVVLGHDTGMQPECAARLESFKGLPASEMFDGSSRLDLVHTEDYIRRVRSACANSEPLEGGTVVCPKSYEAMMYAVGAAVEASHSGQFALVRPPGHHAHSDRAGGFCVFNNMAIAAANLVKEGKRVLIFDFDGHLGDGTSAIFYESKDVMYWSMHQFPAFPGNGTISEMGAGQGEGFTLNVPLPPGSADDIFFDAFEHYLAIARQFKPDVVGLSAGFDAHQYDLLLDLKLSTGAFFRLGKRLAETFPNIFATLEGGYNISELPKCVHAFLAGMNGLPLPEEEPPTISGLRVWETYEMYLHAGLGNLKKYWHI